MWCITPIYGNNGESHNFEIMYTGSNSTVIGDHASHSTVELEDVQSVIHFSQVTPHMFTPSRIATQPGPYVRNAKGSGVCR